MAGTMHTTMSATQPSVPSDDGCGNETTIAGWLVVFGTGVAVAVGVGVAVTAANVARGVSAKASKAPSMCGVTRAHSGR